MLAFSEHDHSPPGPFPMGRYLREPVLTARGKDNLRYLMRMVYTAANTTSSLPFERLITNCLVAAYNVGREDEHLRSSPAPVVAFALLSIVAMAVGLAVGVWVGHRT